MNWQQTLGTRNNNFGQFFPQPGNSPEGAVAVSEETARLIGMKTGTCSRTGNNIGLLGYFYARVLLVNSVSYS
jgi:hypothetical protein